MTKTQLNCFRPMMDTDATVFLTIVGLGPVGVVDAKKVCCG